MMPFEVRLGKALGKVVPGKAKAGGTAVKIALGLMVVKASFDKGGGCGKVALVKATIVKVMVKADREWKVTANTFPAWGMLLAKARLGTARPMNQVGQ